eukprot:CCRYP_021020-RA/>CCRYP_021020-RA protein AED:0.13 eAED:0.13 QI:163/1/1/1/0/0/2/106/489
MILSRSFSTKRSILLSISCTLFYLVLLFNEHLVLQGFLPHVDTTHYSLPNGVDKKNVPNRNAASSNENNAAYPLNDRCVPLSSYSSPPRIYLHIGPHKTGTTSLQDYLACHTDFLAQHHTHYLGKINPNDVKPCRSVPTPDLLRPLIQHPSPKVVERLRRAVSFHLSRNHSVILSSEDMTEIPPGLLVEALSLTEDVNRTTFQIVPVVGYRRYHEWMVSLYRFQYEPHWYDLDRWREWEEEEEEDGESIPTFRTFVNRWNEEGRVHPTLETWFNVSTLLAQFTELSTTAKSTAAAATTIILSCPQILNLHTKDDMTTSFLKLITNTTNPSTFPPPWHTNVHIPKPYAIDAERLALKLYREKRLAPVLPRRVVVNVLQNKMALLYPKSSNGTTTTTTTIVPPLDCLTNKEEEALLRLTRVAEERIVPEFFYNGGGNVSLEEEFREMAREQTAFCNVRLEEMLQESGWDTMLMKLKMGRLREEDFVVPKVA